MSEKDRAPMADEHISDETMREKAGPSRRGFLRNSALAGAGLVAGAGAALARAPLVWVIAGLGSLAVLLAWVRLKP